MAPMSSKTPPTTMPSRREGEQDQPDEGEEDQRDQGRGPAKDEKDQEEEKLHGGGCLSRGYTQRGRGWFPWARTARGSLPLGGFGFLDWDFAALGFTGEGFVDEHLEVGLIF